MNSETSFGHAEMAPTPGDCNCGSASDKEYDSIKRCWEDETGTARDPFPWTQILSWEVSDPSVVTETIIDGDGQVQAAIPDGYVPCQN